MHCDRIPFFEFRGTYATEATAAPAATEAAAAPEATPEEVLQQLVDGGERGVKALKQALSERGFEVSEKRIRKLLKDM